MSVAGIEPSEEFLTTAKQNLGDRVMQIRCTSAEIPLERSSVDVIVSGLVLNFVPDQRTALVEMVRVTVDGGTVGAYVWDYKEKMEFMRIFWDTATELDPYAAKIDEGSRFPLCNPEALAELFSKAGLNGIELTAIDIPTPFVSFEDYWQPFLGGQGPAPNYVMTLVAAARSRLRERLRERIPVKEDGTISLVARAWAIRATVAK
jgi:SAM-dependent methyltransferase